MADRKIIAVVGATGAQGEQGCPQHDDDAITHVEQGAAADDAGRVLRAGPVGLRPAARRGAAPVVPVVPLPGRVPGVAPQGCQAIPRLTRVEVPPKPSSPSSSARFASMEKRSPPKKPLRSVSR